MAPYNLRSRLRRDPSTIASKPCPSIADVPDQAGVQATSASLDFVAKLLADCQITRTQFKTLQSLIEEDLAAKARYGVTKICDAVGDECVDAEADASIASTASDTTTDVT